MDSASPSRGGYRGTTIDIGAVLSACAGAARRRGWKIEELAVSGDLALPIFTRPARPGGGPVFSLYLSAGIHGDEPAGPLAMLRLMEADAWPPSFELRVLPCLNPAGFRLRRRENAVGQDLNRDYRHRESAEVRAHIGWLQRQPAFDLALCLHEDWEAQGFYLYELNPDARPSLAAHILAAVARVCPVEQAEVIEGRPACGGVVRPDLDPALRPQWSEAFWLLQHKARLVYTLEAPSSLALETRVQALAAAVQAVWEIPGA